MINYNYCYYKSTVKGKVEFNLRKYSDYSIKCSSKLKTTKKFFFFVYSFFFKKKIQKLI